MQNRDSFAQQHARADHIVSFFQKLRLDWLLLHFPPRLVPLCLCVFERVRHHRRAGGSRAREPEPLCLSVTGTHRVSSVLYPSWQDLKPAKYCLWSCYWPRLRIWGIRCHRRRSTAIRRASRNFLAKSAGSGSFALSDRRVHGSPRR